MVTLLKKLLVVSYPLTDPMDHDEVEHFLKSVSICLPLGSEDWQVVARLHSENFPAHKRDAAKLKSKSYEILKKNSLQATLSLELSKNHLRKIRSR
jgi:hypothetical protein